MEATTSPGARLDCTYPRTRMLELTESYSPNSSDFEAVLLGGGSWDAVEGCVRVCACACVRVCEGTLGCVPPLPHGRLMSIVWHVCGMVSSTYGAVWR
jgi:hypothetical protein